MKKLTLSIAILATLSSVSFAQSTANNEINFRGEVTDAACSVIAGDINLQSSSVNTLQDAGNAGPWGNNTIKFVNCILDKDPANPISKVDLNIVDGAAAPGNAALWANDGTAGNVGVEVEIAGQKITPTGSPVITQDLTGTTPQVTVRGRTVVAASGPATPGEVSAKVLFVATFK